MKISKKMWKKIRTTNILERAFREENKAAELSFPHVEGAERRFYGVTKGIYQNGYHPSLTISAENLT